MKDIINTVNGLCNLKLDRFLCTNTGIRIHGIPVYIQKANAFERKAWVFTSVCVAKLTNGVDCYLIKVDNNFDSLSNKAKQFLICHELGHCFCGHCDLKSSKIIFYNFLRLVGIAPLENEADCVAICMCDISFYEYKQVMKEMSSVSKQKKISLSKLDMLSRLLTQKKRKLS